MAAATSRKERNVLNLEFQKAPDVNRLDLDDDGANGSVHSRSRFISEEMRHSGVRLA